MGVVWVILGLVACGEVGLVSTEFPEAGVLDVQPGLGLTFGEASPHGKSERDEFRVEANDGDVEIVDGDVEDAPEAFEIYGRSFPVKLREGTDASIVLRFQPPEVRRYEGLLVLELADGTTITRTLLGTGCEDPERDGYC